MISVHPPKVSNPENCGVLLGWEVFSASQILFHITLTKNNSVLFFIIPLSGTYSFPLHADWPKLFSDSFYFFSFQFVIYLPIIAETTGVHLCRSGLETRQRKITTVRYYWYGTCSTRRGSYHFIDSSTVLTTTRRAHKHRPGFAAMAPVSTKLYSTVRSRTQCCFLHIPRLLARLLLL